ncbi:phage portal protein, HK97 family [Paenibacillus algicola]|uniref:Phage portal protein, HK97 family n=1 Tax=Paenibacillus algicola TaxID=2565926 RepID=A0A4P8XRX0_9BACL|nr:phage portal protein [Paenibacillus algicola]QCT03299.1 phage portal protein, HK97 family [Paenibacillus algicola]
MTELKIPIISKFLEKRSEMSDLKNPKRWFYNTFGITAGNGIQVTEATAMKSTAVLACVRVLSETVASLPVPVYRRLKPRGKERISHAVADILQRAPNSKMTAFTFRETMMAHILLWGNCYAEIEYDGNGVIKALWPIPPSRVDMYDTESGDSFYRVTLPNGEQKNIPDYAMFHIPGLGFDGRKGISVISWARRSIELALATEQFGADFFENGTNVGAVATHPGTLTEEAFERLKQSLREKYEGLGNAHRLMLLEEGMTFSKNTIPPNDAQFLETRKFQISEIARLFRVPPHMLADLERATFSNIEQQSIDFVTHTIRPWLVRWEQTINWKLFDSNEQKQIFAEFLIEGLLRGETKARYESYAIARTNGWLSVNDIRELENMNPVEGGDIYLQPLNMKDVNQKEPGKGGDNDEGSQGTTGIGAAGNAAGSEKG